MRTLQRDILGLLRLFGPRVPDRETHAKVISLAEEEETWSSGHDISDMIRDRSRSPEFQEDRARQDQYFFEDMCARCLYNESSPDDPFDYDTPHEISKATFFLARTLGIRSEDVIEILAPHEA